MLSLAESPSSAAEVRDEVPTVDLARAETGMREVLLGLGVQLASDVLDEAPPRVVATLREWFSGIGVDAEEPLKRGSAVPQPAGLVVLQDIEFRSVCRHHLLPFSGVAHVAYLPEDRLVGLGAIVRTLETLGARPQLQEDLTAQFADAILSGAGAAGALVILEARHSCLADRGDRRSRSSTRTSASRGCLAEGDLAGQAWRMITANTTTPAA